MWVLIKSACARRSTKQLQDMVLLSNENNYNIFFVKLPGSIAQSVAADSRYRGHKINTQRGHIIFMEIDLPHLPPPSDNFREAIDSY